MQWLEYQEKVAHHDEAVASAKARSPRNKDYDEVVLEAVRGRWLARLRDPSWEQKRADFIWYTNGRCEDCGGSFSEADLQLHHLHYDTLWYENNSDLKLLCASCHRVADEERARGAARSQRQRWSLEERAKLYKATANRWSGQKDWPVTWDQALEHVRELDRED